MSIYSLGALSGIYPENLLSGILGPMLPPYLFFLSPDLWKAKSDLFFALVNPWLLEYFYTLDINLAKVHGTFLASE